MKQYFQLELVYFDRNAATVAIDKGTLNEKRIFAGRNFKSATFRSKR